MDVSFYNQPQPAQNLLGGIGNTVGIATGLAENRMFNTQAQMLQNELASRNAIGNAFSSAYDPATGTINVPKANAAIAANPQAAYGAPHAFQEAGTLQGTNLANQGANVAQAQTRFNNLYTALTPLLSGNQPPTYSDVINTAGNLLQHGTILPQDFTAFVNEVPRDPNQLSAYIQRKSQSVLPVGEQTTPTPTGFNAQGQPVTGTKGQFVTEATTPAQTGPRGIPTALPPGQETEMAASPTAFAADRQNSSAKIANIRNLTTAIPLLSSMGPSGAGPGSAQWARAMSALQTANIIPQNVDASNVKRDEAQKYLEKYVSTNPVASRSDMAQNLANMSSPNLDTAMAATLSLAKNAVAFDRMDAALPMIYQLQHPNDEHGAAYLAGRPKLQNSLDYRAFGIDQMSPEDRATLQKSLGPKTSPAYKKFVYSYNLARQSGMLNPPQGAQ